jgi:preprotein translocase subunit SecD
MGAANRPTKIFFRLLFTLLLLVGLAVTYQVRQAKRLSDLETQLNERLDKHATSTSAARSEVNSFKERAEQAKDDQMAQEAEELQQALNESVAEERAEILKLWDEARRAGSKKPMPVFGD